MKTYELIEIIDGIVTRVELLKTQYAATGDSHTQTAIAHERECLGLKALNIMYENHQELRNALLTKMSKYDAWSYK